MVRGLRVVMVRRQRRVRRLLHVVVLLVRGLWVVRRRGKGREVLLRRGRLREVV